MPPNDPTQTGGADNVQAQSEFNELLFQSSKEQEKINQLLKQRADILNLNGEQLRSQIETNNSILNAIQGHLFVLQELSFVLH